MPSYYFPELVRMAGDTSTKCGWRKAKSRNECNQYMLESGVASDITIKFPSSEASGSIDKDVPAHKYMLICMSPVFEAMLTGNYQEGGNGITILDVEPDIFMEVLKYVIHVIMLYYVMILIRRNVGRYIYLSRLPTFHLILYCMYIFVIHCQAHKWYMVDDFSEIIDYK